MKKKVLIIGSGGREHALGWKIKQSPLVEKIYFAPGNAGTREIGENIPIGVEEIEKLAEFAKENRVDLTLVGPEGPLVQGIVDLFRQKNLAIVGPSKRASQIESSKQFAKELMTKYGIPTGAYVVFENYNTVKKYLQTATYPLVVKADGLCTGKGVTVCQNKREAIDFCRQLMVDTIFGRSGEKVIVEECLYGQEISFMMITDGKNYLSFPPSQDHKRLLDQDKGPNTGGMGAYAPVPFVSKKLMSQIEKEIVGPTIMAMAKEGLPYQGILYPGLMVTKDGPKVLEYNCRFGDPETQSLLLLLKSDLYTILDNQVKGTLKNKKLVFKKGSAVCIVLASEGYPGHYKKGEIIQGLNGIRNNDVQVFHAGTNYKDNKVLSNGGRVLGMTSYGKNLGQALKKAYKAIGEKGIYFKGMQFRRDIGQKAINYAMIA